jgi:hypothetical protein
VPPSLPRDYTREPTILDRATVHRYVRELVAFANAPDLGRGGGRGAGRSDRRPALGHVRVPRPGARPDVLRAIEAHWSPEPIAYVDGLCTVLANLSIDTRPFLREKLAGEKRAPLRALLAETLAELDRLEGGAPPPAP